MPPWCRPRPHNDQSQRGIIAASVSSIFHDIVQGRTLWKEIAVFDTTEIIGRRITYRKTSNISRTLVGNKLVDNSDVVGHEASPVGAAPSASSFST